MNNTDKKTKETDPIFLNRFTTIQFLKEMLEKKQLTLLNPNNSWEDYNDVFTMELYRKKKNKASVYALCFTNGGETIHTWNAFANNAEGCMIEFDYCKLLEIIKNYDFVNLDKVEYIKRNELKSLEFDIEKLPFLKRHPYRIEKEYRVIALSDEPQQKTFDIPLELDVIKEITISSKMSNDYFSCVHNKLKELISPHLNIKIFHSQLYFNEQWVNHFNKYK
jgi:hypothetical protein